MTLAAYGILKLHIARNGMRQQDMEIRQHEITGAEDNISWYAIAKDNIK